VSISYAALTMNADLGFGAETFGLGAGIFFAGYLLFEIPGALATERNSPRLWLARIMVTRGLISGSMAFMKTAGHFYRLRFLLGAAETSLYPVLYASCIPRFFAAEGPLPVSRGRRPGPLDTGRLAAYYIDTRYIVNG
jgi:ACS family tartrate transporter-like MFS transporter